MCGADPLLRAPLVRQHAYGNVEVVKYHDAFPRPKDDPMAVGFKFGYWGARHYDPSNNSLPPSRSVLAVHTSAAEVDGQSRQTAEGCSPAAPAPPLSPAHP